MINRGGGPPPVPMLWAEIIEEAEATADSFRDEGFSVHVLHPGDVTPLAEEQAFDVLLPGSEFETVKELIERFDPEEVTVYTAQEGAFSYAVVVATDAASAIAICCPIFFETVAGDSFTTDADGASSIGLRLRPLDQSAHVVLTVDDATLLFGD